jgi:hypothetical protein
MKRAALPPAGRIRALPPNSGLPWAGCAPVGRPFPRGCRNPAKCPRLPMHTSVRPRLNRPGSVNNEGTSTGVIGAGLANPKADTKTHQRTQADKNVRAPEECEMRT